MRKKIKNKRWFFKKVNKINTLAWSTKKTERTQITKMRNERGDITIIITEIKTIIQSSPPS